MRHAVAIGHEVPYGRAIGGPFSWTRLVWFAEEDRAKEVSTKVVGMCAGMPWYLTLARNRPPLDVRPPRVFLYLACALTDGNVKARRFDGFFFRYSIGDAAGGTHCTKDDAWTSKGHHAIDLGESVDVFGEGSGWVDAEGRLVVRVTLTISNAQGLVGFTPLQG